jgi:hypothetical protein
MKNRLLAVCSVLSLALAVSAVGPSLAQAQAPETVLKVGGALRFNYFYKSWDGQEANQDKGGDVAFDTFRINVDLTRGKMGFSAEYRFYNGYHMLHHGYLGYKFSEHFEAQLGVHQVPFGIQPYSSNNWFFVLPYYVGLEDDYDLGFKGLINYEGLSVKFAFYKNDEGHYSGGSMDSARYSYDIVKTSNSPHEETNQGNLRVAYTFDHGDFGSSEIGLSGQYGQLYNNDNGNFGSHSAAGLHFNGTYKGFNVKLAGMMYDLDPDTAGGPEAKMMEFGAYDAPYNVAAKASLFVAGLAYTIPINWGPLDSITVYNDYSHMIKDEDDWEDSLMNVFGFMLASGPVYTYFDVAMGKDHPWLGPNWTNGLAMGDPDADWETRFNINMGIYF